MCAPFIDQEFEFTQPDGTKLKVKGSGNAYRAEFETLDGFTVTRNPETGYFDYGIEADGVDSVKSSGVPLGSSVPTGIRVSKGLKKRASGFDGVYALSGDIRPGGRRCDQRRNQKKQFSDFGSFALDSVAAPTAAPPQRQTVGRFVGLTLLIDFSDQMRTMTEAQVEQFLNAPGYSAFGNNGSVRDYFQSVSRGRLDYSNIVAPWYQASKKLKYYADRGAPYGERARELIEEALQHHITEGLDLTSLTTDDANCVYATNVFYAGNRINNWGEGLWPHASYITAPIELAPGAFAHDYQITDMTSELTLGTFCHENGHMLCDFPDLYDYDKKEDGIGNGVGYFCLMCFGGGSGSLATNPIEVGAYLKFAAGWSNVVTKAAAGVQCTLAPASNDMLIHRKNDKEYFLVEARHRAGRDSGLPGSGIALWHVDEAGDNSNEQMTVERHYECALVQADGLFEMERGLSYGEAKDLFQPGQRFSDLTQPAANWWDGSPSGFAISTITQTGPTYRISLA